MPAGCAPVSGKLFFPVKGFALLAILSFFTFPARAQETFLLYSDYSDEQVNTLEINRIIQDREGFIWMATQNGVVKYDGYSFKFYRNDPRRSNSLRHNFVKDVLESRDGRYIWAATYGGSLHRLDKRAGKLDWAPIDHNIDVDAGVFNCLAQAPDGTVWAAGISSLLRVEPETFKHEYLIPQFPGSNARLSVSSLLVFNENHLWLGASRGIMDFDISSRKARNIPECQNENIRCLLRDSRGRVLAGGRNALLVYVPQEGWRRYGFESSNTGQISSILELSPGIFWLGGERGLWRWVERENQPAPVILYDPIGERERHYQILSMFRDRDGGYWLGTATNGLQQLFPEKFHSLPARIRPQLELRHPTVTQIFQADSLLWIGTLRGLQLYSLVEHKEVIPAAGPGLPIFNTRITCMIRDSKGHLWIGTTDNGYYRIRSAEDFIEEGRIEHFDIREDGLEEPRNNSAMRIMEDTEGNLWVGSFGSGLNIRMANTGEAINLKNIEGKAGSLSRNGISGIATDCSGDIWVSTCGGGLNRRRPSGNGRIENRFEHFLHDPEAPGSISHDIILFLYVDSRCRLWAGTYSGGLNMLDPATGKARLFTMEDGLAGNTIYSILEDHAGSLWLSTDNGVSRMIVAEERFINYSMRNGLPFNRHYFFAAHRNEAGRLYFGGLGGLYHFNPSDIKENGNPPEYWITGLRVNNQPVSILPDGILQEDILYTDKITLSFREKSLSLTLSALSYQYPGQNQYAYRLEGFDAGWNKVGNQREITFTNLDPGTYRFQYQAADHAGNWNPEGKELIIEVLPPFWASWWAWLLYTAMALGALGAIYRFQLARRLQLAEARRLRELDAFKTRFYTNITHEFRTPLTVILGLAEQALGNNRPKREEAVRLIVRNGRRLLRLVNQMLDLSKAESGSLRARMAQADIVRFLRYCLESYHSWAETRQVELHFESEAESLLMDFDPEKVQDIFSNLLSNALKATPPGGRITVRVKADGQFLSCAVEDTGHGIEKEHLPLIFDRFYIPPQSPRRGKVPAVGFPEPISSDTPPLSGAPGGAGGWEGTGIGLALTKELLQLLDGRIEVWSERGQGSCFTFFLPIRQEANSPHQSPRRGEESSTVPANIEPSPSHLGRAGEGLGRLLIIEDNADVVYYLRSCLRGRYHLLVAADGQEGVEVALQEVPDIIISDVMMPRRDGLEVCRILKADERTSHIPIILLTARAAIEDKIQGIRRGADAYLSKPFHREELDAHLEQLLLQRRRLQEYFRRPDAPLPGEAERPEAAFLQKVRACILERLEEENFGVEELAGALFLSRTQLFRKVKALTGRNVAAFIHQVRIGQAKQLLTTTNLAVSEIAFQTGFSEASYLRKVFLKETGETLAEFRKKFRKG